MAVSDHIVNSIAPFVQMINPRLLWNLSGGGVFMPFYHAVSNDFLPHISHLYPVKNVATFERDLDFLLKHYHPIDLQEMLKLQERNEVPKKPSFFLSFDDGLREFYTLIAPVLLRKGIPATCFLNSGFVDNKDLFFRYKISLLIEQMRTNPRAMSASLNELVGSKNASFEELKIYLLNLKYSDGDLITEIGKELAFDFNDYLKNKRPYLTSIEVRELIGQGFSFGAHSIDHPEYRFISEPDQRHQTKVSMDGIAHQFNLDVRAFSFPFTDHEVAKNHIDWMHQDCGVSMSFGCAGHKKDMARNHYQRVAFENKDFSARKIHNAELAYSIMRELIGKNTVMRHG